MILISDFITVWQEIVCRIPMFIEIWDGFLWLILIDLNNSWPVLINIPCVLENTVYSIYEHQINLGNCMVQIFYRFITLLDLYTHNGWRNVGISSPVGWEVIHYMFLVVILKIFADLIKKSKVNFPTFFLNNTDSF